MEKMDDANTTGCYRVVLACITGNGYEVGKVYSIYIEATVDGDTGGKTYEFTVTAAAIPESHLAESSNDTTGTIDSGSFVSTQVIDATDWQISPVGSAVGGFGLNVTLVFDIGTGTDRIPSQVNLTGYFDANPQRYVHVWAYNYLSTAWEQLSDSGSGMKGNASNDLNYIYALTNNHVDTATGAVLIRFTSTSITTADDLYLNHVEVTSVAEAAAGTTPEAIAQAVHAHDVSVHTGHNTAGFRTSLSMIGEYDITTSNTALTFTCSSLPSTANYYQGCHVRIHDVTNDRYADSWISSMDNAGVVTLGRALPFVPDTSSELFVMGIRVTPVEMVTALMADTGFTAGGSMTFAEQLKVVAAWCAGNWKLKSNSTSTYQLLDADDGATVILEMTLSQTTPYRTISIS